MISCSACFGQMNVFLDYSNFETRLSELASSAGVDNFSAAEVTSIRAGIKTNLETMFSQFDGISFTESDPGGARPELLFGLEGGGLGVADHIDFLNVAIQDTARVFTAQFGFVVDEFSGGNNRSDQLSQLTAALSGTAAHELGHNLGLRHHDAHGDLTYEGTPVNTNGVEDTRIMATGSTGLSEAGREVIRDFSVNSLVKLAYANQTLLSGNPQAANEVGDAGDTIADAQVVDFETIPVANRFGEVIIGSIDSNNDVDLYEVQLAANSVFTIDVNNDVIATTFFRNFDNEIALLDDQGNVLYSSTDTFYSTTQFGAGDGRDFDGVLYNVNIFDQGTYYVRINSQGGSSFGDYRVLMHSNLLAATIPEPSSALFCLSALSCILGRRRRNPTA
ncbi:MAG: hypothetical protein AAF939_04085 [Planctomycetota bacterium]